MKLAQFNVTCIVIGICKKINKPCCDVSENVESVHITRYATRSYPQTKCLVETGKTVKGKDTMIQS
ncbi:hypothetical protein PR048_029780 [Dryococelus australis]|uniref:Uncharacterized protein n=1 Tax=Dryococelus australis TaxID=614101 RepID=A0ABQ9G735_9NEOP|nr:hypothetical protein PR048_029780 [Dryococelus australis]